MDINILGQAPQTLYRRIAASTKATDPVPASLTRKIPRLSDQALKEEGKDEQTIHEATKKEEDKQTVSDLIKKSNRCIISISS